MKVSVVIPCFNESGNLENLSNELGKILSCYDDYEVVFVDDGSVDNSFEILTKLSSEDKHVKYLSFSRNFGHQAALKAGIDYSTGDVLVTLDADFQHPPQLIPELIEKWKEGYDVVQTVRQDNKSLGFFKKKASDLFYKFINFISEVEITKAAADFRVLDKKVVEELKRINERDIFFRGIIPWLGFKTFYYPYKVDQRRWGVSQYTLKKMVLLALSGISSFSTMPLMLSTIIGLIITSLAFIYALYAIYVKLFTTHVVSGWTSLLVSILFIGGIQLIFLGVIGQYLGKLFLDTKGRPIYVVNQKSEDL